jgi:ribosome biogenesis GTPase
MKKLHIADRDDEQVYTDVDRYAKMCKFINCKHQNEPDCAVITAINNGELTEDNLKRYFKLLRANEVLTTNQNITMSGRTLQYI